MKKIINLLFLILILSFTNCQDNIEIEIPCWEIILREPNEVNAWFQSFVMNPETGTLITHESGYCDCYEAMDTKEVEPGLWVRVGLYNLP